MEPTPGEDAVNTAEKTRRDLEYYYIQASSIKQQQGLRGLTTILKEVLLWVVKVEEQKC